MHKNVVSNYDTSWQLVLIILHMWEQKPSFSAQTHFFKLWKEAFYAETVVTVQLTANKKTISRSDYTKPNDR